MQDDYAYTPGQRHAAAAVETDRSWLVLLHLSQFFGYLIPFAGFVAPILFWQLQKDASPELDLHGRNVANWIVSWTIYAAVSGLMCVIGVGLLMLLALAVMAVVFPIVGAAKAAHGVVWRYPLAIRFF